MKFIDVFVQTFIGLLVSCLVGYWYFHYIKIIIDNNSFPQMIGATIILLLIVYAIFKIIFTIKPFSKK